MFTDFGILATASCERIDTLQHANERGHWHQWFIMAHASHACDTKDEAETLRHCLELQTIMRANLYTVSVPLSLIIFDLSIRILKPLSAFEGMTVVIPRRAVAVVFVVAAARSLK